MSGAFRSPKLVQTGEPQADDLSRELRQVVRTLADSPFAQGRLLTGAPSADGTGHTTDGFACASGVPMQVPHGLGRRALGFIKVAPAHLAGGAALDLVSDPTGVDLAHAIRFVPSATGKCWIWVF